MAGSEEEDEKEEAEGETLMLVMAGHSRPKDGVLRTPTSRPSTSSDLALSQDVDARVEPAHDR